MEKKATGVFNTKRAMELDPHRDHWVPAAFLLSKKEAAFMKRIPISPKVSSTPSPIRGGGRVSPKERLFHVVDKRGNFLLDERNIIKTYKARGPLQAAKKAFYSHMRTDKGKAEVKRFSRTKEGQRARKKHLDAARLTKLVHKNLSKRIDDSDTMTRKYVKKCMQEDPSLLDFKCEIHVMEREKAFPRKYIMQYRRNEAPNVHQAQKLITKDVHATYVPRTSRKRRRSEVF